MRLASFFSVLVWGLVLSPVAPTAGCAQKPDPGSHSSETLPFDSIGPKDVPYVATPQRVVERMLELAEVSTGDVVYDLGSGDGRFLITAAQQYGARGVGFEIDPQLVEQARANARLAGVTDHVEFRQQDLFEANLRDASVVMLYLEPELNLRLRPRLLLQLDPGDRVVSHDFDMGTWTPDRVEQMEGSTLYRWTIPRQVPDSLKHRERSP